MKNAFMGIVYIAIVKTPKSAFFSFTPCVWAMSGQFIVLACYLIGAFAQFLSSKHLIQDFKDISFVLCSAITWQHCQLSMCLYKHS